MARSRLKTSLNRSDVINKLLSCQNVQQRIQVICQHRLVFHGILTAAQLLRIERYYQGNHHDEFNQGIDNLIIHVIAQKWQVKLPHLSSSPKSLTDNQFAARVNQKYVDAKRMIRRQQLRIRRIKYGH